MKFNLSEAKKKLEQENVYEDPQAIGTEGYHQISFIKSLVATDGVANMCTKLACFWVTDIIASYLPQLKGKDGFFTIKVTRTDKGATFTADDGNGKIYITQEIDYTDLTYDLKMFLVDSGEYWVVMLPSEY